ncbi:MAG: capsular polysaccharide synthesis protein [Simplicispira sp.]|nr:capsular polysaccharide synthesis protein [Simplicispira sp.]
MKTAPLTFKTRAELWLARWLQRFYRLRHRPLEACLPQHFEAYAFGNAAPVVSAIPPILWAFWDGATPPLLIARCFANWRAMNPGFSIRILSEATVRDYLPDLPASLAALPVAKRSDWIRLELLKRHGGIWLDASTVLTESLDWVLAQQQRTQCEFVGYYLERYTTQAQCPVVESWFMAAVPQSRFVADLQHEFTSEVISRSGEEYIEALQARGIYESVRQNIDIPAYLSIHLAMQATLQQKTGYRLCLAKAEDGPFFLHVLGHWGRTPLKIRLMFSRVQGAVPPLVKLRSPDRKRLDLYLARGLYVPGSLADVYLLPAATTQTNK